MSEISKCTGFDGDRACPLRETCYRFTAPESEWQSYIAAPYDFKEEWCRLYWRTKEMRADETE